MIEVTNEMINAFYLAGNGPDVSPGISAVLAIVERDYRIEPRLTGDSLPPKSASCPECKAMTGTRHLDGCSGQYREDYVGGDA